MYYQFDVSSDGFFWGFDQACDGMGAFSSNECDVVYMNCGIHDPAGDFLTAVLAHEFEHLIHYNYDMDEYAWLDEGLAELAMWLYGHPDTISDFPGDPDKNLTNFSGYWRDYIKSYLFSLYFYERYGGQSSVLSLVAHPANSTAGIDAVLSAQGYTEDFEAVFRDWVVANFLDDTSIGDGRFGYVGETLPPFGTIGQHTACPVDSVEQRVKPWAADYARFTGCPAPHMGFDGSDNNRFSVRAMLLDATNPTEVVDMVLDGQQRGTLALPQLGTTHSEAVLVYSGVQDTGTKNYLYTAGSGVVGAPETVPDRHFLRVRGSGSATPVVVFDIAAEHAGARAHLALYDATGRLVRHLFDGPAQAGSRECAWDGTDPSGRAVASGVYFARLRVGEEEAAARVVLIR
ncbi:MAG: FlgD immunoglobulin-like domain containing protein [Gemmatimonadota bacterium]|nr:hypothetical protein [Gemmatimonadota bacterium]MDP6528306.1 FlgD immunoglobulin-like domain containing protein [Gemmatimonadota bacterium]MDP6803507.1 FlgD immunoglobulin-like domain containing protein [Gemmatimonadota bacterium]MDP7031840.1 FlgD immunoglobulin-like domain containing protein [Gemmatimonadota bacterium]